MKAPRPMRFIGYALLSVIRVIREITREITRGVIRIIRVIRFIRIIRSIRVIRVLRTIRIFGVLRVINLVRHLSSMETTWPIRQGPKVCQAERGRQRSHATCRRDGPDVDWRRWLHQSGDPRQRERE
jgi:hypothetical protein